MKKISIEQVINLHQKMIKTTGGKKGVRDKSLLESALNNAFVTFDNIELYPSTEEKCANICFAIINNHPFIDGNKRLGIFIMLVLLDYNGIVLQYEQNDLVDLGLGIAKGIYNQIYILDWIKNHEGH